MRGRWRSLLCVAFAIPCTATALTIEYSDPRFYVANTVSASYVDGRPSGFVVYEERVSPESITLDTDIGYAHPAASSAFLALGASAHVDTTQMSSLGQRTLSNEGLSMFEVSFRVAGEPGSTYELLVTKDHDLFTEIVGPVSPSAGQPGHSATTGFESFHVIRPDDSRILIGTDSGTKRLELQANTLYRLELGINAIASGRETSGSATAIRSLNVTIEIVPEPETALLLLAGLVGLAMVRRRRTGVQNADARDESDPSRESVSFSSAG